MKPNPNKGRYAVLFAEYATGIVLNKHYTFSLDEEDIAVYTYFEEFGLAKTHVIQQVTNKNTIEGVIYQTSNHSLLFVYDQNGERRIGEEGG